jgi:hypothetical protein
VTPREEERGHGAGPQTPAQGYAPYREPEPPPQHRGGFDEPWPQDPGAPEAESGGPRQARGGWFDAQESGGPGQERGGWFEGDAAWPGQERGGSGTQLGSPAPAWGTDDQGSPQPGRDWGGFDAGAGVPAQDRGGFNGGNPPVLSPPAPGDQGGGGAPAVPPPTFAPPAPPGAGPGAQVYAPPEGRYGVQPGERYGGAASGEPVRTVGAEDAPYALKRPIGRQIVLAILSFGLWGYYWFYDTRRKIDGELGKPSDAGVKTACLLIPIYNWFLVYQLWEDLNKLRKSRFGLPDMNSLVLLLFAIFVPFAVLYSFPKVAIALNDYWDHRTHGQARDAPLTRVEKILAAIGPVLIALVVVLVVVAVAI